MVMMIALVSAFVIGVGLVMAAYVGTTKVPGMLAQRKLMGRLESLSAPVDEPDAAGGSGDDSHGEGAGVAEGSDAVS